MAAAEYYSGACMEFVPKHLLAPHILQRAQTERIDRRADDIDIAQGIIMWLPAAEELPERAVRRAHGKGAVEDGIYNHPVVVVSRPVEEERAVHFHLITSLQGKKLEQLYPKSNEFHTSRRSWYLPISPSPDHPDANSKRTKKRFPTLSLADGATLRWDSYVNIRHVYRIDWALLKPYTNLNTSRTSSFRLERESVVRMVAKGKILTMYEPGPQLQTDLRRTFTAPSRLSTDSSPTVVLNEQRSISPDLVADTIAPPEFPVVLDPKTSKNPMLIGDGSWSIDLPPAEPLDCKKKRSFLGRLWKKLFCSWGV